MAFYIFQNKIFITSTGIKTGKIHVLLKIRFSMIKKFKILKKGFNMKKLTKKLLASLMAVVMVSGISVYAQGDLADVNSDECLSMSYSACTHNMIIKTSRTVTDKRIVSSHHINLYNSIGEIVVTENCRIMQITYKCTYNCAACGAFQFYTTETEEEHMNSHCPMS